MTDVDRLIAARCSEDVNAASRPRSLDDFVGQKARGISPGFHANHRQVGDIATAPAIRATRRLGKRALAHRPPRVIFVI